MYTTEDLLKDCAQNLIRDVKEGRPEEDIINRLRNLIQVAPETDDYRY